MYKAFKKKLGKYRPTSMEDAENAVYDEETGLFDKSEALLFIVYFGYDGDISKEDYYDLCSERPEALKARIQEIKRDNDGSDIFGYDEDDDTYSLDD